MKMMTIVLFIAYAACATAHWTHDESLAQEIGAPEGEFMPNGHVALLQEKTGEDVSQTYRFTFGTSKDNNCADASTHVFQVQLTGMNGLKSGFVDLRYYVPRLTYAQCSGEVGAVAPALFPGYSPKQDLNPACGASDCRQFLATQAPTSDQYACSNIVQQAWISVTTADTAQIGSLKTVEIREKAGQPGNADNWIPKFIKIATADATTGIGSGAYYIKGGEAGGPNNALFTAEVKTDPDTPTDVSDDSQRAGTTEMILCRAQFCEEEMDTKMMSM